MSSFITHYYASREEQDLFIDHQPYYVLVDALELIEAMILGHKVSASTVGLSDALEDGSLWGDLCLRHGDQAIQQALEDVHCLIVTHESQPPLAA